MQVEDSTPARPNRTVVWLKDGEVVVTEDNRKYRHYRKKKRLQIFDLTYADQGTYECGFSANDTEQRGVAELWCECLNTKPLIRTPLIRTPDQDTTDQDTSDQDT